MATTLAQAKTALRRTIKAKLKALDAADIAAQSQIVIEKLRALEAFQRARSVSIFVSLPHEVETRGIIREMLRTGKRVFLPRYREGTKEMDMVQVSSEKEFDALPRTKWNIQQPSMDAVCAEAIDAGGLDLVICPGVAFTIEGHRCGYGMGYYDRYLTKLRNSCPNKKAVLVGLAFKVQIVDNAELPWEDTDIKMDRILHS